MKHLWIVLALVACGDDSSSGPSPDGGGVDDAPMDEVVAADCTGAAAVTVVAPAFDPERKQPTFSLVSHDANGRMCATKPAGNTPGATTMIDVPPMGMVTLALAEDGDRFLYTWTEVQPGDELRFPSPFPVGATATMVEVTTTIPVQTGVTSYDVYVQCEHGGGDSTNGAPAGAFSMTVECRSTATAVAVMIKADGASTTHYALSAITPIAASGPTAVTVGAYALAASPTVTLRETTGFDRAYVGFTPGATQDFHSVTMLAFASSVTDPVTVGPRTVPATWELGVTAAISQTAEPAHTLQILRHQDTTAPLDLDVTTDFLPLLSANLAAGLPRPAITWSAARTTTADAVYVNAGNWLMVTRAVPGTVTFPEVPAAVLPTEAAHVEAVVLIDAESVSGFEELRRDPALPYLDRESSASSIGDTISGLVP